MRSFLLRQNGSVREKERERERERTEQREWDCSALEKRERGKEEKGDTNTLTWSETLSGGEGEERHVSSQKS